MSEETHASGGKPQPLYKRGIPNAERQHFILLGMTGLGPTPATEAASAVARELGRPVEFVDEAGYEREIIAGTVEAGGGRLAWVESKSRELEGGIVDVEFRLKATEDGRPLIDWVVETYNPYFGCRVGYLAWHGRWLVMVYREKHHTYACCFPPGGAVRRERITDDWVVANGQIAFVSDRPDVVERLSLPDLERLADLDADQAKSAGVLPPTFFEVNALRKEWERRQASPEWQDRLRAKIEKIERRAGGKEQAGEKPER